MRARVFLEAPGDVQEAVRVILLYLQLERSGRPRALYRRSIKRACRLLKVMAEWNDGLPSWVLAKEWKARLKSAGLDPENPLRVINQRAWDNAWEQLVETETYRSDIAARDKAYGKRSERASPRVKAIAVRAKKQTNEATFKMPKLK